MTKNEFIGNLYMNILQKSIKSECQMTIGIAALAENGKKLIVASDQMITSPIGTMSYQWQSSDIHKIFIIPEFKGAILMAGAESNARIIINKSIDLIQSKNTKSE